MLHLNYYIKKENKWVKKDFLKNIKSIQTKNKIAYLWLYDNNHKKIGKIKITEVANV